MPVSEQRLSGLVVVVAFYCVFVFFFFLEWGYERGVASTLTGVLTHVGMVLACTCKCKLSISFTSLKLNSHSNIILGWAQKFLIPNAFRIMVIKYYGHNRGTKKNKS